jgi:putative ABC transport system substrate-binding protein
MQLRRDVAFWPSKMLSLAAIEEGLIGDPAERLLRLLADPQDEWEALQQEGNAKGYVEARDPEAFDRAFADMTRAHAGALLVFGDAMVFQHRSRLAELAATSRLPTMHNIRPFVEAGGLMAYEPRPPDLRRRAAVYVDKILKGAKPADLPVEQPMTFELVINLKTAQALGLTIPSALLFQATEIIR